MLFFETLKKIDEFTYETKEPKKYNFLQDLFHLNDSTIKLLKMQKPKFGYDGFGEFLFYRTYSRIKPDGYNEDWADCVIRVVNGVMNIRKNWYVKNNIEWNEIKYQRFAKDFALSMFNMEWLPPGRGLWSMGTDYISDTGGIALYNCAFVSINDLPKDMHWTMDLLMNGVGVGFGISRTNQKLFMPTSQKIKVIIGDTREAWCDSVRILLESFCCESHPEVEFDYSQIRKAGLPIKRFGGISSGPEPLIKLHEKIRKFCMMANHDNTYSESMLKADIANCIGCCVVAGNVRRSAMIAIGSIDDQDFLNLKDYDHHKFAYRAEHGWMSNNTVRLEKDEDFQKLGEISRRLVKKGEPGYLNLLNVKKYGRVGKEDGMKQDNAVGLNPCFSGDTLVAVADGRESVSFEELVKENKDIPVYCLNDRNKVVIRMMRNPRKTGYKQKLLKITLDDGSIIRSTENHKFKIRNGEFIEAKDLKYGDSLEIMTKFIATMKDVIGGNGSNSDYWWVNNGLRNNIAEHRLIAKEFLGNIDCKVVHHKDNNSLNNCIENLEIMDKSVHDNLHKEKMEMFNNPMCQEHSKEWWKKYHNNMSKSTSGLKNGNSNNITNEEIRNICLEQTEEIGRKLSKKEWLIICKNKNIPTYFAEFRKKELGTISSLLKWCAEERGFDSNVRVNELGVTYNHKVVNVEFDSFQDIYNGTVDEFHNYYVGGFESKTRDNKKKLVFVNVKNCGEIPLSSYGVCNLAETFPTRCDNVEIWLNACKHATFYCSTITLLPTHRPETNALINSDRRIGVGLVDFTGWIHNHGVCNVTKWLREGYKIVKQTNEELAKESGTPASLRLTTVKPGGTVPKLAGVTSGISYPSFKYTLRRVRVQKNSPMEFFLKMHEVPFEDDFYSDNTTVFEFPIKQGPAKVSSEVSLWEQAMNLVLVQREWSDNAVSNTLNFKPEWELIKSELCKDVDELFKVITEYSNEFGFDSILDNVNVLDSSTHFSFDNNYKISVDASEEEIIIQLYKFNPKNEEDQIEAVLSSIAPLTKSVTMLPHTSKGVYKQMPEEEITEDQYIQRKSSIKKFDWSKFKNSRAVGEVYCDGDKCSIL